MQKDVLSLPARVRERGRGACQRDRSGRFGLQATTHAARAWSVKSTSRSSQSVFLQEVGQTSVAKAMAQLKAVTDTSAEAPSHRQPASMGWSARADASSRLMWACPIPAKPNRTGRPDRAINRQASGAISWRATKQLQQSAARHSD